MRDSEKALEKQAFCSTAVWFVIGSAGSHQVRFHKRVAHCRETDVPESTSTKKSSLSQTLVKNPLGTLQEPSIS